MIVTLISVLCVTGGVLGQSSCETDRLNAVKSGQAVPQGVNVGSWFVLEGWMATTVWTDNGCDQWASPGLYLLEQCLGNKAKDALERHWSTWITENDFAEMSRRGINVVRIPVGWWTIYDTQGGVANASLNWNVTPRTYTPGGLAYLDKAFEWGKNHGIGIIVDLHAAPGSQNGNDHSSPMWPGQVDWDKSDDNIGQSVDSMELFAERYGTHDALFGFAVLNEPVMVDIGKLQDYYKRVYEAIRRHSPDSYIIIAGLTGPWEIGLEDHWISFMNPDQGYSKVAMDVHYYSCYGGKGDSSDIDSNINYINYDVQQNINDYKARNPKLLVIGEWSVCQHGDQNRNPDFFKIQYDVYSTASLGFTFWSWKVPGQTIWNLHDLFEEHWFDNFRQPC